MTAALSTPHPRDADPPPPLENGERLTANEFLRRYEAMPDGVRAELIEGRVYIDMSPVSGHHGRPHATLGFWLGYYTSRTPGLMFYDNTTTRLDADNTVQPDLSLTVPSASTGKIAEDAKGYIVGGPQLVAEIANTTRSLDLNEKLHAYRRNGVQEYLVWRTRDAAVDWFVLEGDDYARLDPDPADGLLKSRVYPGLWLDVAALLEHDLAAVAAAVERGCTGGDHTAFAKMIATA